MRILYLSPRQYWPVNTGARLRDYHLARELTNYATVTYAGLRQLHEEFVVPPDNPGFEKVLCWERQRAYRPQTIVRGLLGPDPIPVLNYSSPAADRNLAGLLRTTRFDTVQLEGVHLSHYVSLIRAIAPEAAIVADWHNIESELMARFANTTGSLPRRWVGKRTAILLERAESKMLRQCDAHTVASERERESLTQRCSSAVLRTIPNGVDVRHYCGIGAQEPRNSVLFVGSMDYHANIDAAIWLAREIWPEVRRRRPGLKLMLVGRSPGPEVRTLACEDIVVTGTVDDVRPYYGAALAVLTPLRVGSGTRLKILEAMAAGVPVVSTSLGAEGLEVSAGRDILLAETPAALSDAVFRLTSDPALRESLAAAGRDLVNNSYDWSRLGRLLFDVHQSAAERRLSGRKLADPVI